METLPVGDVVVAANRLVRALRAVTKTRLELRLTDDDYEIAHLTAIAIAQFNSDVTKPPTAVAAAA